jgi:flavin-binding protein dodecin
MSVYRVIDVIGTSSQSWKTPRFLAAVHRAGDFRDACGFRRC